MSPRGGRDTKRRVRRHDGPTPRQQEVLALVARGHCSEEIAMRLGIKKSTVERHVVAARTTLQARTRVQAAALVVPEANGTPTSTLTHDEQRVLSLLRDGLAVGEAAHELHISRRTADRRLAAARTKLGVGTTAEAVVAVCPDQGEGEGEASLAPTSRA